MKPARCTMHLADECDCEEHMSINIEIYQGRRRLRQVWRWRAVADNGRIVATSGESYTNHQDVVDALKLLFGGGIQLGNILEQKEKPDG